MSAFANRTHLLEEVAPAWRRNLVNQVLDAPDWDTRFRRAKRALALKPHGPAPDPEIVWAWQKLRQSRGRFPSLAWWQSWAAALRGW